MKEFFKFMFASFAGTILTIIVIILMFAGMIASIVAMSGDEEVKITENTILHIDWKGEIKDRGSDNPFENFNFSTMESEKPIGLYDILKTLEKAKKDDRIAGIFLDMETIPAGISTLEEIRNKLLEVKESGKFIISYANGYDQKAYYLASLSDEIYLNKEGMILFKGLNAQLLFLKNMLEKLDIDIQVVRGPDNKYKSAVEPLMRDNISEANKEQMQTLMNSIWGNLIMAISESRGISIEQLNMIADNLELNTSQKALDHKFIDGAVYRDEVISILKDKTGVSDDEDLNTVSFTKYIKSKLKNEEGLKRDRIAIVFAQGSIVQGKSDGTNIGSASTAKALRDAHTNDKVKALVFRVNSGGGDALASEIIRREVELAKEKMPVIVSMGDVAASGGYWISTNADYIFASPTTITGSIGVFGIIPNMGKMMEKKLGINFDNVMTNKNSDFIDVFKPLSPYQYEVLNNDVKKIYDDFTKLVSTTRNLDINYVDSIAKGRVWSGIDAKAIGLIDEFGGLESAVLYAAEKADLAEGYRITTYPEKKEFIQQIMEEITGQSTSYLVKRELGDYYKYYQDIQSLKEMNGVQARLPFFFEIN